MLISLNGLPFRVVSIVFLIAVLLLPVSAITLSDVMDAALKNDTSISDARSKLKIAENNLCKSYSLYDTNLSLSASLRGASKSSTLGASVAGTDSTGVQQSVTANLSVPLAKWISIGVEGVTDAESLTGSFTLSLSPLAKADTQTEFAWNKAVIDAQNAVRTTLLTVRKEYRSVLTSQAEYEYRKAAVLSAQNELARIQYLIGLGNERKSQELTIYSDLMDAQGYLDTAENNQSIAIQNLSLRTGIDVSSLVDITDLEMAKERTLLTEETWISRSADMAIAKNTFDSVLLSSKQSSTFPGLSLVTSVTDTLGWTVSAKVSVSPDVFFQKTYNSLSENLAIQQRSVIITERAVRTAWKNQQNSVVMALRNFENANRFMESAKVSYTETELLLERGDASRSSLDSANENLLSAKYQLQKAIESLENARDQLDANWQLEL